MHSYDSVIEELELLIRHNQDFHDELIKALAERPGKNHWAGKNIDDFLGFFRDWLISVPSAEENKATYYEYALGKFYSQDRKPIEPAKSFIRKKIFSNWLEKFVKAHGEFLTSIESSKDIEQWIKKPEVKIDDYLIPPEGFSSFNDFFTRKIKEAARPIDAPHDNSILISPVDATIDPTLITLTQSTELSIKEETLNISKLLGDDALASEFQGGTALSFYLDITDYHHFHSPIGGTVCRTKFLGGLYFGVNDFYYENHRGYYLIETQGYGKIILVAIGITTISSIYFTHINKSEIKKGDELGHFAYGGSAILLLFQPGYLGQLSVTEKKHVLMGERIGVLKISS